jgi:hypothetical protein
MVQIGWPDSSYLADKGVLQEGAAASTQSDVVIELMTVLRSVLLANQVNHYSLLELLLSAQLLADAHLEILL